MDAYDIFKKLTKGLKFKQRFLGLSNSDQNVKQILKKETDLKKEELSDHDSEPEQSNVEDNGDFQESGESSKEEENNLDGDLELLEGVTVSKTSKQRKEKKTKLSLEELKKKKNLEEENRFRNEYGIKAVGRHITSALRDFDDLVTRYNVSLDMVDTIKKCGYEEPTPIQRQALPALLEGRQIVATAPTGSGKTAAFLVPLLHFLGAPSGGPRALILCPTRELAHQIYREALRLSVSTQLRCSVIKSVKSSKVKERESTIRKSDLVISTPNRLCYMLNREDVNISLQKVQWLIIDEADKMFEGSEEEVDTFRQQLGVVLASLDVRRRIALFSATHTPALAKWARKHLRGLIVLTVGHRNAAATTVQQELLFCGNESGKLIAFRQLVQKGLKPPVLVFVQSKERAKQLFKELLYDGINVDVIHADRTQAQRDRVVRSFRVGRIWVLICTELMGRGIDFRGVNLVVNYDFPPSAIAYIHRVGRAGRAGQKGRAVTFFTQDDVVNLRSIASVMKQSGCEVPEYMLSIKQDSNRRKLLLKKAPHRDKISTVLEKPNKRKLEKHAVEDIKNVGETNLVKNSKHEKIRRLSKDNKSPKKGLKKKENMGKTNNIKMKKRKSLKPV
ncbi:probable ATP-dependent RNA helicase DDX52 isoform X2 [Pieris rapae]|uniref:probable ATP-dependent RNA helicase DDX52 isoform X2 n=1 Tax=Pieris rapae TaxID=64459 RepID=UPI001E27C0FA|nr:probable ATP-dependent RNA helicase DDX52 isoform X2 [Pieris rapae]